MLWQGVRHQLSWARLTLKINAQVLLIKKGFPVLVGAQYDRKVPLKPTIERARLDAELQALAESRKRSGVDVEARRSELLQQRLKTIARTHGDEARAEIAAACKELEDGEIVCKGD